MAVEIQYEWLHPSPSFFLSSIPLVIYLLPLTLIPSICPSCHHASVSFFLSFVSFIPLFSSIQNMQLQGISNEKYQLCCVLSYFNVFSEVCTYINISIVSAIKHPPKQTSKWVSYSAQCGERMWRISHCCRLLGGVGKANVAHAHISWYAD